MSPRCNLDRKPRSLILWLDTVSMLWSYFGNPSIGCWFVTNPHLQIMMDGWTDIQGKNNMYMGGDKTSRFYNFWYFSCAMYLLQQRHLFTLNFQMSILQDHTQSFMLNSYLPIAKNLGGPALTFRQTWLFTLWPLIMQPKFDPQHQNTAWFVVTRLKMSLLWKLPAVRPRKCRDFWKTRVLISCYNSYLNQSFQHHLTWLSPELVHKLQAYNQTCHGIPWQRWNPADWRSPPSLSDIAAVCMTSPATHLLLWRGLSEIVLVSK